MSEPHEHKAIDWKIHGVKVIPGDQLDPNTAQTPGMDRAAAINLARVGAQKIWAGTVKIHPNARTGSWSVFLYSSCTRPCPSIPSRPVACSISHSQGHR